MSAFVSGLMLELEGREAIGKLSEAKLRRIDWLAVAVGNLGGIGPASRVLGFSRQTIYTWLEEGLGGVSFDKVTKLSQMGDVPLEYLSRRLSVWKESVESEVDRRPKQGSNTDQARGKH